MSKGRKILLQEEVLSSLPKNVRDFERAIGYGTRDREGLVIKKAIATLQSNPRLLPYSDFILYGGEGIPFLILSSIAPVLGAFNKSANSIFRSARLTDEGLHFDMPFVAEADEDEEDLGLGKRGRRGIILKIKDTSKEVSRRKLLQRIAKYLSEVGVSDLPKTAKLKAFHRAVSTNVGGFNLKVDLVFYRGEFRVEFEGFGYNWFFRIDVEDEGSIQYLPYEYIIYKPIMRWDGMNSFIGAVGDEYREILKNKGGSAQAIRGLFSLTGYPFRYRGDLRRPGQNVLSALSGGDLFLINDVFKMEVEPFPFEEGVKLRKKIDDAIKGMIDLADKAFEAAKSMVQDIKQEAPVTVESSAFYHILSNTNPEISENREGEVTVPDRFTVLHVILKKMKNIRETDEELMRIENELKSAFGEELKEGKKIYNLHDYAWVVVSVKDEEGLWWSFEGRLYGVVIEGKNYKEIYPIGMEIYDVYIPDDYLEVPPKKKQELLEKVLSHLGNYLADPTWKGWEGQADISFSEDTDL